MNIKISIQVVYYLQTHIYKCKTDLNMRTILGKKKVNSVIANLFFEKLRYLILLLMIKFSKFQWPNKTLNEERCH